jgi:hypothetical protein
MSKVFVLDTLKQPLTPVHPGRARLLLKAGKAAVYRTYPFTLILKRQVEHPAPAALRLKIDPGRKAGCPKHYTFGINRMLAVQRGQVCAHLADTGLTLIPDEFVRTNDL